jgi:hypothetical protein
MLYLFCLSRFYDKLQGYIAPLICPVFFLILFEKRYVGESGSRRLALGAGQSTVPIHSETFTFTVIQSDYSVFLCFSLWFNNIHLLFSLLKRNSELQIHPLAFSLPDCSCCSPHTPPEWDRGGIRQALGWKKRGERQTWQKAIDRITLFRKLDYKEKIINS